MTTLHKAALCMFFAPMIASADIVVGGDSVNCADDPACINRVHSDIPMAATARPGERITMIGRDAGDLQLDADEFSVAESSPREGFGVVHPLVGPVFIEGAEAGDILAVTIESIKPGPVGWTSASTGGFAGDMVGTESRFIVWRLNEEYAESDALPGVRIPNSSFPGVIMTLPNAGQLAEILDREQRLADAGGAVYSPDPDLAEPSSLCGVEGTKTGVMVKCRARRSRWMRISPSRPVSSKMGGAWLTDPITRGQPRCWTFLHRVSMRRRDSP